MKKLYLLRHAEAANPEGMEDHDRPLNHRGTQECKKMDKYLTGNNIKPDIILCSDAIRTIQTAKNVFAGQNNINIILNKKLYLATPGEIIKEIAKISDKVNSAMIVAHNPGIEQLLRVLAGSGRLDILPYIKNQYPTCALTEFSFNVESWKNIEPGSGSLESFVTPKQLGVLL